MGYLNNSYRCCCNMVRVAINPYQNADWTNQFKANLHTHTTQSDGSIALVDVISAYDAVNYDILAITDHDLTNWPWASVPSGMLAVPGHEISSVDHVGALFATRGSYTANMNTALIELSTDSGLGVVNHPGRYVQTNQFYINLFDSYPALVGLEVYNQGDRYSNDRTLWDNLLNVTLGRSAGKRPIYGLSNDDMHLAAHQFKNYQFMLMPELTIDALKNCLRNGAYYFCYETAGNGTPAIPRISIIAVTADAITITATGATTIQWISAGQVVGTGASIALAGLSDKNYVRAVLTNASGVTLTQPFALAATAVRRGGGMLNAMAIGIGFGSGKSNNAQTIVTRGLWGYYKFNEGSGQVINDSSGLNFHGTLGLDNTVEAVDPAWEGASLSFNSAESDVVKIGNVNKVLRTAQIVFYNNGILDAASAQCLVDLLGTDKSSIRFGSCTSNLTNEIITILRGTVERQGWCGDGNITVGWHLLEIVWTDTTYDIWLDGSKKTVTSWISSGQSHQPVTVTGLHFGKSILDGAPFAGKLKNAALFYDVALTETELYRNRKLLGF